MTLLERIKRGEEAIAAAKSQGRDVADWEAHIEMLKRQASECAEPVITGVDINAFFTKLGITPPSPEDFPEGHYLRAWMEEKPGTIRYMTDEQRAELFADIDAEVDRFKACLEKSREPGTMAGSFPPLCSSNLPHIDSKGSLRIPFNCPKKYRWWDGGQSIAETLAELRSERRG